jgi:predicted ester cyclase
MSRDDIIRAYLDYIDCLNRQDWANLYRYVAERVEYNGKRIDLAGYRAMLIGDFKAIPDLSFNVVHLVCDPPLIACSLAFDCKPVGQLFDLPVNGKRVQFVENVFYAFKDGRIINVNSVIDKAAIAAQI